MSRLGSVAALASVLALAAFLSGCSKDGHSIRGSVAGKDHVYTFYVYRSQSDATYPPKNVNAANLVGVVWYLQNEVMIETPPKFGISRVLRYKVQTRAPAALLAKGMDFGVRYAYDSQLCTGPGNCTEMYEKYGYFVGCNTFESMYPFPNKETIYNSFPADFPGGMWYSFPGEGACEGTPTGSDNCTYSYSWPADEVSLEEIMGNAGSDFWANPNSTEANAAKVKAVAAAFEKKYPKTEDLTNPCDFDNDTFWN